MQNRVEEARLVLLKTIENDADVEERLMEIQQAARISDVDKYDEKSVLREMLIPSASVRRMLFVGLGIQVFQQTTGIDTIVYYSPESFKNAGIESNSKLLAITVAVAPALRRHNWNDHLFINSRLYSLLGKGRLVIALAVLRVCACLAFFSLGLGPICSILTSEVFPLRLRAQAYALAAVVNRLCSGFVTMSFLSLAQALTVGGTFFIFAALSALSVLFVHTLVPETRGKS
ncbi:hypothetical protein SLEP1_g44853 [Rubroshorea leprosula]|uniref:Major facilitator superfamily (MFS) profile domain-containing protein n=1 Tax=Rubroshorea leprosula TaxID=152421 RepID=A0AAV5LIP1_9ROSI|nr:hypothetical protein SLEP1_g44853 [Rubroshorea leprosula]